MSTPPAIIVTGSIVTSPESRAELLAASLAHVHRSRAEPGCIEHGVYLDAEDPNRVFFFERWADRAALDEHFVQMGSADFLGVVQRLAVGRTTLDIFEVGDSPAPAGGSHRYPPSS